MLETLINSAGDFEEPVGIFVPAHRKENLPMARKNEQNIKRNYKDSLFRMLFKDPEHLLELYNAINGTHSKMLLLML